MLSLNANQLSLVADDSKTVRWAFTVYDNVGGAVSTPIIMDFAGIELRRNQSESGIIAPSEVTFSISNPNNTLNFLNIKGGTVLIELFLTSPTIAETKITGWLFNIKTCEPGYQKLKVVAEDFLQQYIQGDYPNTRMVADIFPANRVYGSNSICVPVVFGTAYIPLRDVYIVGAVTGETISSGTFISTAVGGSGSCYFLDIDNLSFPFIADGSTIVVSGFTTSANNGTFTVIRSTPGTIQVTPVVGFATEAAGDSVTVAMDGGTSGQGYILLGDTSVTYTISKVRSPRSLGTKIEYTSANYSFNQSTKTDDATVDWRVFQAIIADSNSDGIMDAHGFFGTGNPMLDPLVQFTRSDTISMTGPAAILEYVLEDMGVPSAKIDTAGTFTTSGTTYGTWTLAFNGGYYFKQSRAKVLSQLLNMCHSCLDVGESVQLRVLSKTSRATITSADVLRTVDQGEGSFSYRSIVSTDYSDSCYITWQQSGEAQDEFLKTLVSAGASSTVISNIVLECPFVQDSQNVQRIGKLFAQRKFQKEAEVSFLAPGTRLALQPDDVITISSANYGGTYAVLIDSMTINKDCSIKFTCSKYTTAFDDWGDLSPTALTIADDLVASSWQPTISGTTTDINYNRDPVSPRSGTAVGVNAATTYPNELLWASDTQTLYVEQDGAKIQIGGSDNFLVSQVFS